MSQRAVQEWVENAAARTALIKAAQVMRQALDDVSIVNEDFRHGYLTACRTLDKFAERFDR